MMRSNGKIDCGVGPEYHNNGDNYHERSNDYSNEDSGIIFDNISVDKNTYIIYWILTLINSCKSQ